MIYNFIYPLADIFTPFNLFRYLTFRSIAAFLTALIISFVIGGGLIRFLRSKQKQGQPIREDGPVSHVISKKGTPTMGGLLILISLVIATLLWADLTNRYVWIVLGVTVAFGIVGFLDDFLKVTKRNTKGVPGKVKFATSLVVAGVAAYFAAQGSPTPLRYMLAFPFLKDVLLPLGMIGFVAFAAFVIVGTSNAVNLTDGLDGLAIGPVIMAAMVFACSPTSWATCATRATCSCRTCRAPANWPCCCRRWSARGSASCGSTRRPRWSSWATPDRLRSAARSARPRS